MVRAALAAAGLTPALVCRPPAGMLLLWTPAVLPVTSTLMVQPPAGMLAPLA
jgi:hypothetical protein